MKAAIITPGRDVDEILHHLKRLDPNFSPEVWPDIEDPDQIIAALVWKTPGDTMHKFKNLKLICSFGAGVDHLVLKSSIPNSVSITRFVDPSLSKSVTKYCLMAILAYQKNFRDHILNKEVKKWEWKEDCPEPVVGIMGMGVIGKEIAFHLRDLGYRINGYSQSPKEIEGINHYPGASNLPKFLQSSDLLVNIMPLTNETRSFFNTNFFSLCKKGSYLINLGRGQHVVDNDLLKAIESSILSGATLDVFNEEPLPPNHPFWTCRQITMTPHVAGLTAPIPAAIQFYENFIRLKKGQPLANLVDRSKGY